MLAAAALSARADGFVAAGGYQSGIHHASATAVAGYTTDAKGTVSHGDLAATTRGASSGIESVAASAVSLQVSYKASEALLTVAGSDSADITVYSVLGRMMLNVKGTQADLADLPAGVYVVRVSAGSSVQTIKIAR